MQDLHDWEIQYSVLVKHCHRNLLWKIVNHKCYDIISVNREVLYSHLLQEKHVPYYPLYKQPAYKHMRLYTGHKNMCLYSVDIHQSVNK